MEGIVRRRPPEEGESYFMSMTDMMVGLLLIFIILLAYFALNLREEREKLDGANQTRAKILKKLERSLLKKGIEVTIDEKTGVLRLPEKILFEKGQWELNESGKQAISKLSNAMIEVLPCYTASELCKGERSIHLIDAIFVEGHTDSDAMRGKMNNYLLSLRRAETTFTMLQSNQHALKGFLNKPKGQPGSAPILSLSGYGPDRPIDERVSEEAKTRNRRIDLRFLMTTPSAGLDKDILRQKK